MKPLPKSHDDLLPPPSPLQMVQHPLRGATRRAPATLHPHTAILRTRSREEVLALVLRRLRSIFGQEPRSSGEPSPLFRPKGSRDGEDRYGGRPAARLARQAMDVTGRSRKGGAERRSREGDSSSTRRASPKASSAAIPTSGFPPSTNGAAITKQALHACEAFVVLATSGAMPRGAQRSADRKLPWFEARIERYQRLLDQP